MTTVDRLLLTGFTTARHMNAARLTHTDLALWLIDAQNQARAVDVISPNGDAIREEVRKAHWRAYEVAEDAVMRRLGL